MVLYRPMVDGDVYAGLSLSRAAGWNQTVEDWELFLKLSPRGCCVAVDDEGEVRGTVTTVRYDDHFSWIAMVLVDPAFQRKGIGIQLLRESLHILKEEQTVKLDATPAGRKIYLQLDFVDEYPMIRMENSRVKQASVRDSDARLILPNDLPLVIEHDRKVFGANREPVLKSLLRRSPRYAYLAEDSNGIAGYCFGRPGHYFTHIGPVVSQDFYTATQVVSAALRNNADGAVVIDVPHHDPDWIQWLSSIGFTEQRPLVRMYRGANSFPGIPEQQFAILGPEFG